MKKSIMIMPTHTVNIQKAYQNLIEASKSIELDREKKEKKYMLDKLTVLTKGKQIVLENKVKK